jgi:hypothetical protein
MKSLTVRESINSALCEELKRDPKVFIIGNFFFFDKNIYIFCKKIINFFIIS